MKPFCRHSILFLSRLLVQQSRGAKPILDISYLNNNAPRALSTQ